MKGRYIEWDVIIDVSREPITGSWCQETANPKPSYCDTGMWLGIPLILTGQTGLAFNLIWFAFLLRIIHESSHTTITFLECPFFFPHQSSVKLILPCVI